jgi:colanic acid biosynthesis glycosyl transferase WcaI
VARVLIYSLVFPPDGVSTAQLMGELAQDLVAAGHEVSVISTQPHYSRDLVAEAAQPLRPWRGRLIYESRFRGIRVLHIAVSQNRRSLVQRVWGWLGFHVIGFALALRSVPKADVIVVPSPLLTAGLVAWAITITRGGRYVYNVQELYPELAIQMGRLRNRGAIAVLRKLEKFVYDTASAVVGISEGICSQVIARGTPPSKVHLIPNFVDLAELSPGERDNPFSREYGLTEDFVVSYAGNMGPAQGLETVLDAAALPTARRVKFVLIGGGVLESSIAMHIATRKLDNVQLIGHQPYVRVPEIYAASDVCLVPLLEEVTGSALPSKIFRIMACARPVLAICKTNSELAEMVREAGAGVVVPPGRADLLRDAVEALAAQPDLRKEMGRRGRAFVERQYARPTVTGRYSRLIDDLTRSTAYSSSHA